MDDKIRLNDQEEQELLEGDRIFEMTKTSGFEVLRTWLEDMAFHAWVDPREIEGDDPKKIWEWRELNAFHAANNARELLEKIQKAVTQSEYLGKLKSGEITRKSMKF